MFNQRTLKIEESIHVVFDEFSSSDDKMRDQDNQGDCIHVPTQLSLKETSKELQGSLMGNDSSFQDSSQQFTPQKQWKFMGDHP